jgi:hypothetical protein
MQFLDFSGEVNVQLSHEGLSGEVRVTKNFSSTLARMHYM